MKVGGPSSHHHCIFSVSNPQLADFIPDYGIVCKISHLYACLAIGLEDKPGCINFTFSLNELEGCCS